MADPAIARLVADSDVLAADLLVGGAAREALDLPRTHDWIKLLASETVLADAEAVIGTLADADLAADWRGAIEVLVEIVDPEATGHPALVAAHAGDARHVLSLDPDLTSAGAGTAIRRTAGVETSVKRPAAFVRLFDPATIHPAAVGGAYPGPDREPPG